MPKKPPKNAFYFYMMDFREEQRKKGIKYPDTKAVAEAAGPYWKDLSVAGRAKYEAIAKKEKSKYNVPEMKFTSTGISYAELEQQEKEKREMEEYERRDINSLFKSKALSNIMLTEDIFLIDVNYFCKVGDTYLIGEHTILRFNLTDGIQDRYHEIINPGVIPTGYASDVKIACEELALEMPDSSHPTNRLQVLANMFDYLKKKNPDVKVLPPVFTMPDKVAPVRSYIHQLCSQAGEDETLFRVYKLDYLFFVLINSIKTDPEDGFPKESLAFELLKKDSFQYTMGIGCEVHESLDKAVVCSLSRAKRWAYTIMDSCCPLVNIQMIEGKHVPLNFSMEDFMAYKDQKAGIRGASVAGAGCLYNDLCGSEDSYASSMQGDKPKQTYPGLRKPQDRSRTINAPDLNEGKFRLSIGRGRGLCNSFSGLNLD